MKKNIAIVTETITLNKNMRDIIALVQVTSVFIYIIYKIYKIICEFINLLFCINIIK